MRLKRAAAAVPLRPGLKHQVGHRNRCVPDQMLRTMSLQAFHDLALSLEKVGIVDRESVFYDRRTKAFRQM